MPGAIYQLAGLLLANPIPLSDEEFQSNLLRFPGGDGIWYAVRMQIDRVDGRAAELTYIHFPLQSASEFRAFRQLLDTSGRSSHGFSGSIPAETRFHVIPADQLRRPARDIVNEVLKHRSSVASTYCERG